tara:strand:+ start:606 stop:887 length:282 start_codon:yes stop_codon:yes gene_type:complete
VLIYEKCVISDVLKKNLLGIDILRDIDIDEQPNNSNDNIEETTDDNECDNDNENVKESNMGIKVSPLGRKNHLKTKAFNVVLEELKNQKKKNK